MVWEFVSFVGGEGKAVVWKVIASCGRRTELQGSLGREG